MEKITDFAPVF